MGGQWTVAAEKATAGEGARLTFNYQAKDVYLVLGGTGTVGVQVNGGATRTVQVTGAPTLYTWSTGSTRSWPGSTSRSAQGFRPTRSPSAEPPPYPGVVAPKTPAARVEDVHRLALAMPHVTVEHGGSREAGLRGGRQELHLLSHPPA